MSLPAAGDSLIDPSLRALDPVQAQGARGKRKARRSTSRSRAGAGEGVAGAVAGPSHPAGGRRASKRLSGGDGDPEAAEPARGEEANLIQGPWEKEVPAGVSGGGEGGGGRGTAKRAKLDDEGSGKSWQTDVEAGPPKQRGQAQITVPKVRDERPATGP